MAEESRNEIVSEILNVMDMLYRRAFLTKSQGDRYRNARGTLAMELAVMEEENERLKAALTAPTAPTAAPAPSPEAAVGECQHEAWEENGGWCKCVDCDMGWHMRDGHPTPRDVVRPTPEAQPPHVGEVIAEMRQEQDRAHLGRFGHRVRDWADRLSTHPTPEAQEARSAARFYAACQRAAAELPFGYEIRVCLESGSGTVELCDPDGNVTHMDEDADDRLTAEVNAAIDAALALPAQGEG